MKCPHCGHWNKASLPRCFQCGQPLLVQPDYERNQGPGWQHELKEAAPKVYIRADEQGEAESITDKRDALAHEMVELKARKARGEKHQRTLREESSRRGLVPSSMTVRTNTTRETIFRLRDDPETTLRPMPPELVEGGEVDSTARLVFTSRIKRTGPDRAEEPDGEDVFPGAQHTSQWVPPSGKAAGTHAVYDGFNDSAAYEPLWGDLQPGGVTQPQAYSSRRPIPKRIKKHRLLRAALIVMLAFVLFLAGSIGVSAWNRRQEEERLKLRPTVVASILNDQAAHTITIPGQDGTQIYVKEMSNTYVISGGMAVVEIPDYIWYNDYEDYLSETMDVTLTPYIRTSSGQHQPMAPISFQVQVPLSPIELVTPDSTYVEVSTAMYPMKFRVREGSTVTINGSNYSDLVNQERGDVTYNATVQPIGENKVTIKVRSQYCRENVVEIILYRARQEVPLDLTSDQTYTSSKKSMRITATTIPGAEVNVLTPHTDLDITNISTDGTFSFFAVFNQIGSNAVTVQAEIPGRQPSVLNFEVYYVPPEAEYTRKAWGIDTTKAAHITNYNNLLANNAQMVKNAQIYLCTGVITEIISTKPQLAIMNTGTEEKTQYVMLENSTKTTWEVGASYRIFADAFGMYNDMPRLVARYTYKK